MSTAFVYHSKKQAEAALTAAVRAGSGVTLLTAPGAARHGGPEYLFEMVRSARADVEAADVVAMIDCGGDAGTAMRALRSGWRDLVLAAPPDVVEKVSDMALQLGGVVRREAPQAVDLLSARDPIQTCMQAFQQETDSSTEGKDDQR